MKGNWRSTEEWGALGERCCLDTDPDLPAGSCLTVSGPWASQGSVGPIRPMGLGPVTSRFFWSRHSGMQEAGPLGCHGDQRVASQRRPRSCLPSGAARGFLLCTEPAAQPWEQWRPRPRSDTGLPHSPPARVVGLRYLIPLSSASHLVWRPPGTKEHHAAHSSRLIHRK